MKKILIATVDMKMGGIEKSLIQILEILKEKYDVTLVLVSDKGELLNKIPKEIRRITMFGEYNSGIEKFKNYILNLDIKKGITYGYNFFNYIKCKNRTKQDDYYIKCSELIDEEFDLAIAYHGQISLPIKYIIKNVKARKKIAWIHSDPNFYKSWMKNYEMYYEEIDKFFCVSKGVKESFDKIYPNYKYKTDVFTNILNIEEIKALSNLDMSEEFDKEYINITTVGRLEEEKGQHIIPFVIEELVKKQLKVKWYLIGDGSYKSIIEKYIKEKNLQNNVVILGIKDNPYPYIKNSDIYIQTSIHESYGLTIAEAKILEKIIISTDTIGGREQINNEYNGLIVKYDVDEIKNKILEVIENKSLIENIELNIKNINICNDIYKIDNLLL